MRSDVPSSKVGSGDLEIATTGAGAAGAFGAGAAAGTAAGAFGAGAAVGMAAGAFGRTAGTPCARPGPASSDARTKVAAANRTGRLAIIIRPSFRIRISPNRDRGRGPSVQGVHRIGRKSPPAPGRKL